MARNDLLRALNRAAILNIIKANGSIARTDIARLTGLSPASVTGLTADLIEDGLIFEKQEGRSRGGRRPILLALDAAGGYVVGIKLAEEHVTLALTDLNANVIAQQTIELVIRDPVSVSDCLAEGVRALLEVKQINRARLLGVGVGLAGMVDSTTGVCRVSPHNGWRNVPFAELLEDRLDFPVYLDNNVNTLTLCQKLYGNYQHVQDFLVVTVGRGVGMGIVANGRVYRGTRNSGGELGHTVIDPSGPLCNCGNRGCLETFVAEPWLVRRARLNGLEVNTPDALAAAAAASNPVAIDIYTQAGHILGQAIANMVNLFNPSLILISGEGVRAGEFFFDPMRLAMQRHIFGQLADDVELRIEPLEDDIWARGAASLVLNKIFHVPI